MDSLLYNTQILQGLNRRSRVCAGSHMWIHGPFRNREKKNAYHRFYDLAAEACELLGDADGLLVPPDNDTGGAEAEAERAKQVLGNILDLISRLKQWTRDPDVVFSRSQFNGPARPFDNAAAARHRLDRARARGYPTTTTITMTMTTTAAEAVVSNSGGLRDGKTTIYWQRMMHSYCALRLDLYMTILDNPLLMATLHASEDLQVLLEVDLLEGPFKDDTEAAVLITTECRTLANDIATNCTDTTCNSSVQSFGSLVAVYTLETALRWYKGHNDDDDDDVDEDDETETETETNRSLQRHCREVLDGMIRTEEARGPCPFNVSLLSDEVLRRGWC